MKTTYIRIFLTILLVISCYSKTTASETLFNDNWKFSRISKEMENDTTLALSNYNDTQWERVSLPHTARNEEYVVQDQWQGVCWYRKSFSVKDDPALGVYLLRLDGAMNLADLWVNGKHIKHHIGGFLPVVADMTKFLKKGENIIAVRLNNYDNPLTGPKPLHLLDFNTYGGLYRNAWIVHKEKVYVTDPILENKTAGGGVYITFPRIDKDLAEVDVRVNVRNENNQNKKVKVVSVISKNGKPVATNTSNEVLIQSETSFDFAIRMNVASPLLWSPRTPELYEQITTVICEGKQIDRVVTKIGIRKFHFDGQNLLINGEKMFLRGVNRHQEYPYVGYALSDNAQWRDAQKIKQAGFDYVRLSHYPQSTAFMDACDALGLVVIDAIPGWQFFNQDARFADYIESTARDMIRRDRNHPCVLAWEVSLNETDMPRAFIDRMIATAQEEYPGCYTAGWMTYGYDIYLEARQHRKSNDVTLSKPYNVSEYGDWEYYAKNAGLNQDKWGDLKQEERTSRQLLEFGEVRLLQQATNIQEAHNDNFRTPAYSDGYWVMFDYNRGYAEDLEASGIMSIDRLPKFSYYFFQSQRNFKESQPMVYIANYWTKKSPLDVRVFSNCDEVELFLNGKSVERRKPDVNTISDKLAHPPFTFHLPLFEPGTLTAKGYIAGKEMASYVVSTPNKASKIMLEVDESQVKAEYNDLLFVHARVTDSNGTLIRYNTGSVKFSITKGNDCELVGDNPATVRAGVASILLRTGSKSRKITISSVAEVNGITLKGEGSISVAKPR